MKVGCSILRQNVTLFKIESVYTMLRTTILLFLFSYTSFSQNYVINGSFERTPAIAKGVAPACAFSGNPDMLNNYAQGWQTFVNMTPDLLVTDSALRCTMMPMPRSGNRMVGLIMYHPSSDSPNAYDYHELIQGSLAKPLEKGKTYRIRFRTLADDSLGLHHLTGVYGTIKNIRPVQCGNFGFYFSKDKININENFAQSQIIFPVQPQINREAVVSPPAGEWTQVSMLFTADQPYRYFLFGNFFSDAVTALNLTDTERSRIDEVNRGTDLMPSKIRRIAYYCFDDFVVEAYDEADYAKILLEEQKLTFDAELLFDVDQAILKSAAKESLEQFATALFQLPDLRIEIGGHTDTSGDTAHNQSLSDLRALAVYNYLVEKGVSAAQLTWKGYGESQPVAPNSSTMGRQQNRRVECNLLKKN